MDNNNNNTWLWILLLFGVYWLLTNHAQSKQQQLFVVTGHEQHVGISDADGLEEESDGVVRTQRKGQVHHMLSRLSDTHNTVRNYYEIFENLAVGAEKILTVVNSFSK